MHPRLADFRALSDADVRPDRRGVVIAEGQSVVERLLGSPYPVRAVIGEPHRIEALAIEQIQRETRKLKVGVFVEVGAGKDSTVTSEEFKQLVVAVWNRIQNLDLPDTSTYAQTAPGMRKFAQDLIS